MDGFDFLGRISSISELAHAASSKVADIVLVWMPMASWAYGLNCKTTVSQLQNLGRNLIPFCRNSPLCSLIAMLNTNRCLF